MNDRSARLHVRLGLLSFALVVSGCRCDGPMVLADGGLDSEDGGDAGADAGMPDGGFDAGADAGLDAGFDSGVDAGSDAGGDAGTDGGFDGGMDSGVDAGAPNQLYAHIGGRLVRVDVATGALSEMGPTGAGWLVIAWDNAAKVARAISPPYSPNAGPAAPMLRTINLCTGAISDAGVALALNGVMAVRRAEGLARNPDGGTFHITTGITGTSTPTEFQSESNGTVDISTGAVTVLGNHQTYQDDGDGLLFIGDTLHLYDIATGSNQGGLYRVDTSNGQATKVLDPGPKVLRYAYDSSRGVVFVAYGETNNTARGIGILNMTDGGVAKLGADLSNAIYLNQPFTSLVSVPAATCP